MRIITLCLSLLMLTAGYGSPWSYAATVPLDISDAELHAIGVYEGDVHKNGKIRVRVSIIERPVVLFLSAYESVEWMIELEQGVSIKAVILSGYHKQTASGLSRDVPLFTSSYDEGSAGPSYEFPGYRFPQFIDRVKHLFGQAPKTAYAQYRGAEFLLTGRALSDSPDLKRFRPAQPTDQPTGPTLRREGSIATKGEVGIPVTAGAGTISSATIDKYNTLAVSKLSDAPGAPDSGSIAAGILSVQLASRGFTVIERAHLEKLFDEQKLQLTHGDETVNQLNIGKLVGAKGLIVGEVTQWTTKQVISEQGERYRETNVAIAFRLLDVETGAILFSGNGHFPRPSISSLEGAAQLILRQLAGRLAFKGGLISTGRPGFVWEMEVRSGLPSFMVTEFDTDSPAYKAGVRSGDVIISCNGSKSDNWKTLWQSMRACQAEAGQPLALEIARGTERLTIIVTTSNRFVSSQ